MTEPNQQTTSADISPPVAMLQMISGSLVAQPIYVAAQLGIADLLKDGPLHSDELARRTATHAPSLYRVLRLLAALGVFAEDDQGRFALTPLGACLQTGVPGSVRAWALASGSPEMLVPLAHLLHSVQTGAPAFDHIHGMGVFEYFAQHPAFGAMFNAAQAERTAAVAPTVAAAYDFSGLPTVVDVGGSHGILLAAILQAHPTVHGVVFDLPHVVEGARGSLAAAGVMHRCEVVGGDFFAAVPSHGDAYLLANVVHDWEDERAVTILRNCRQAMTENGKVLLVERLLPADGPRPLPTLVSCERVWFSY